jgi:hypothetical protein
MTKLLAIPVALFVLAGCSSLPSAGSTGSQASSGVEIWRGDNRPSRAYRVIGSMSRQGADNSATYQLEEALLLDDAAKQGADGIIIQDESMVMGRIDAITGRPMSAPHVDAQLIKFQ